MSWLEPNITPPCGEEFAGDTLGHHLDSGLSRLMRALGQEARLPRARMVARVLSRGWGNWPATRRPAWPSDITDDHTPFEFSLALNGRSETVRILTEPQDAADPSLTASWKKALEIHASLSAQWGTDFRNFERVADLFTPTATGESRFCAWHSAVLGDASDPQFKIYLNPMIHGDGNSRAVVTEALSRLGLAKLWADFVSRHFGSDDADCPIYFSLDLVGTPDARVKIYVAHRSATATRMTRILAGSPGFEAGNVRRWCRALMGSSGPFDRRPLITCFALRPGAMELHSTTLHLPVRCYVSDDFEIARRTCSFLNFPQRVRFMRAITALSERPLESGRGLQTYVSLRASPGTQALTIYLAPLVYSTAGDEPRSFFQGDHFPGCRPVSLGAVSSDNQ
jgi:DMATS type aromatic prenyltransferase